MLLLTTHALSYSSRMTYAESFIPNSCTRQLQVGTYIMYSPALADDNFYEITFRSASRGTLRCGDTYEPGEDLEIHMAVPSNHEVVFDLFGGAKFYFGHCSPESDANGSGNNPGVRGRSGNTGNTGTLYYPLSTPADGAEISVVAAYGKNSNQVWVTEPCTLVGGAAAVSPSPSPPRPALAPPSPPPPPSPSPPPPPPPVLPADAPTSAAAALAAAVAEAVAAAAVGRAVAAAPPAATVADAVAAADAALDAPRPPPPPLAVSARRRRRRRRRLGRVHAQRSSTRVGGA